MAKRVVKTQRSESKRGLLGLLDTREEAAAPARPGKAGPARARKASKPRVSRSRAVGSGAPLGASRGRACLEFGPFEKKPLGAAASPGLDAPAAGGFGAAAVSEGRAIAASSESGAPGGLLAPLKAGEAVEEGDEAFKGASGDPLGGFERARGERPPKGKILNWLARKRELLARRPADPSGKAPSGPFALGDFDPPLDFGAADGGGALADFGERTGDPPAPPAEIALGGLLGTAGQAPLEERPKYPFFGGDPAFPVFFIDAPPNFPEEKRKAAVLEGDQVEREACSRSVIFGLLKSGREASLRRLETGPIPELGLLRGRAEAFEESLGRTLGWFEDEFAKYRARVSKKEGANASKSKGGESGDAAVGALLESLGNASACYWHIVGKKAAALDRAASRVAYKAGNLAMIEGDCEPDLRRLSDLRLVDFESACWKLGAFIDAALESFRLLHRGGEARACSGLGEGQPPSSRGYGPEPGDSSVFEMAAAIRLVLGGMAKDLAFAADSGLPGRVRVSRLFRLLPFLDWRGLRSRLGALESELLRMPENDPAFGSCAARALAIRRLVEFGPGRLGDRLGAAAKSIIGVWRLLEPFHHQPGGLSGPAAN